MGNRSVESKRRQRAAQKRKKRLKFRLEREQLRQKANNGDVSTIQKSVSFLPSKEVLASKFIVPISTLTSHHQNEVMLPANMLPSNKVELPPPKEVGMPHVLSTNTDVPPSSARVVDMQVDCRKAISSDPPFATGTTPPSMPLSDMPSTAVPTPSDMPPSSKIDLPPPTAKEVDMLPSNVPSSNAVLVKNVGVQPFVPDNPLSSMPPSDMPSTDVSDMPPSSKVDLQPVPPTAKEVDMLPSAVLVKNVGVPPFVPDNPLSSMPPPSSSKIDLPPPTAKEVDMLPSNVPLSNAVLVKNVGVPPLVPDNPLSSMPPSHLPTPSNMRISRAVQTPSMVDVRKVDKFLSCKVAFNQATVSISCEDSASYKEYVESQRMLLSITRQVYSYCEKLKEKVEIMTEECERIKKRCSSQM